MSDISIHLTWVDVLLAIPVLGWPGLLIGAVLGALLWRTRRVTGATLGALIGCVLWCAVIFIPKLL